MGIDKKTVRTNAAIENREQWVDSFRGLGAILVVLGHGLPFYHTVKMIYAFHMPLFFILSGYLFNYAKWSEQGLKKLIISKIKSYMIPFLFCRLSI